MIAATPLPDGGRSVGGRRHLRAAPARGHPPRLRRQHQPRAEDAGGRHGPAGRDAAGRGRPPGRQPAGRADRERGVPARPHHRGPARAQPHRGRGDRRPRAGARPACWWPTPSSASARPPSRPASTSRSSEPDDAWRVLGDRRQLVSALYNLLDNAVKYSDEGDEVEVRAIADGHEVVLAGAGPRHRHPQGRPRAGLRALLPGRPGPQPHDRRHRPRPGHRPPRRHQPRGRGARRVPPGRGLDLHASSSRGQARARHGRDRRPHATAERQATDDARPRPCWSSRTRTRSSTRSPSGSRARASGERRPRRRRGARHVRRRAARPRAARRDAAQGVGPRRVPRAAVALERADHHGHGQGRRDRHGRRASRSAPTTT